MARPRRPRFGGQVVHVLNRAVRRFTLFQQPNDYEAFEQVLVEAGRRVPMRVLCFVLMPNHWHLVLWPLEDRDLSTYMHWVTTTHSVRWHVAHGTAGLGAVYQGRFKAIPVRCDEQFLALCRYVECNPVRAGLVEAAEDWNWSSASRLDRPIGLSLHEWPVPRPGDWLARLKLAAE